MNFRSEPSCIDKRTYRVDLPSDTPTQELVARLVDRGQMTRETSFPGSHTLRSTNRTEVVIVQRTGRVQIRVDIDVPRAERRLEAERALAALVRAMMLR